MNFAASHSRYFDISVLDLSSRSEISSTLIKIYNRIRFRDLFYYKMQMIIGWRLVDLTNKTIASGLGSAADDHLMTVPKAGKVWQGRLKAPCEARPPRCLYVFITSFDFCKSLGGSKLLFPLTICSKPPTIFPLGR